MEFLFIADVHLTEYKNSKQVMYNNRIISKKTKDTMECLFELGEYATDSKVKTIIIGGDMVDKHDMEYCSSISLWDEYFECFSNLEFILITGNHDISDKSSNPFNWCDKFEKHKNVSVISYAQFTTMDNILLCSFSNDMMGTLREAVENYPECDILISHFDVNEARLSNNITGIGKIRFSDLKNQFKLILLGDYHIPQLLEMGSSRLYYVGSVIQKNWGESGEEKRFFHYNDLWPELIKSIKFTKYSKHIRLELNSLDVLKQITEKKKQLEQEGNYVKIIYNLPENLDKRKQSQLKRTLAKMDEHDIIIVTSPEESDVENIDIKSSNKDKIIKYLELKGIPENMINVYLDPIKSYI